MAKINVNYISYNSYHTGIVDDITTLKTSDRMVKDLKDLFSDIFYSDQIWKHY